MAIDIEALLARLDIVHVIENYIPLEKKGVNYSACCPFHDEKTPSFSVNPTKQFYYCFGCGAGGDAIQFITDYCRIDFKEACEQLEKNNFLAADPIKRESKHVDIYAGYEACIPAPEEITSTKISILNPKKVEENGFNPGNWNIESWFPYTTSIGEISHYVVRAIINDKKITPTIYWCNWPDKKGSGWTIYKPEGKQILYNLHTIKKNVEAVVYIVEGEKAAAMGIQETNFMNESIIFTCWPGGTNGAHKVDFSPLAGRKIILIPDNDKQGFKCLRGENKDGDKVPGVIDFLNQVNVQSIEFCIPEDTQPKGWDIADKDDKREPAWKQGELVAWLKATKRKRLRLHKDEKAEKLEKKSPSDNADTAEEYESPDLEHAKRFDLTEMPFKILGYNRDIRYYIPHSTQQIVELSAAGHTKNQLMNLAGLEYWLVEFGDGQKTRKINWDLATNALLKASANKGLFDMKNSLRGRGAWLDEGRSILHLGENVYVDGEEYLPEDVESKFIYEKNHAIGFTFTEAATDEEATILVDLFKELSWENPLSAFLIAGWTIIAPVCGILKWRPHIWVTGASSTGKSTALKTIVEPMLGSFVFAMEGNSTEPGIRQTVGQDARPVILDEAEGEDKQNADRMQQILNLARVSSSGGTVTKGSQDGLGTAFCVRSCFCFSAINPTVKHLAD